MAASPSAEPTAKPSGGGSRDTVVAIVALVLGVALCAGIVFYGPGLAEKTLPLLPAAQAENGPLIETVFVAVIFGAMIVIAAIIAALMRINAFSLGRAPVKALAIGIALGMGGVLVATGYAKLAGTLVDGPNVAAPATMLLWGLGVVLIQAGAEEVYFRGWLQPVLARAWGPVAAVLLTAAAFAGLHIMGGARSPVTLVNLALGGIMFGVLAVKGGGIAAALGAHVAWNATEQLAVGLDPNPGLGGFGAAVDFDLALGQALWGGSDEGLNASIAMTFALLAILVPLLMIARRPTVAPEPIARVSTG